MNPPHLPPHTIPLGHPSAPAPSIQYHALNLDWQFVSYMILYMFQCHSPKSSHPLPLPQSPKDCSIHRCLFCCLAYRVIVTIEKAVSKVKETVQNHLVSKWQRWALGFPGSLAGKESICNAGDLGWEDPLEEGIATHSSILAWRIRMDRGTWWATVHGVAKSWTLSTPQRRAVNRSVVSESPMIFLKYRVS